MPPLSSLYTWTGTLVPNRLEFDETMTQFMVCATACRKSKLQAQRHLEQERLAKIKQPKMTVPSPPSLPTVVEEPDVPRVMGTIAGLQKQMAEREAKLQVCRVLDGYSESSFMITCHDGLFDSLLRRIIISAVSV